MDNTVLFDVSYGMYIVSANAGNTPGGCVVNTVSQITSEDPIFAISMNKDNYTYELIKESGSFSINIISESTNPSLIALFGFRSGKDTNKYERCNYEMIDNLPVIHENCTGSILCDLVSITEVETHCIILGRVKNLVRHNSLPPMTYSYYHKVVKGKASKNAPTYKSNEGLIKRTTLEESPANETPTNEDKVSYRCSVCGYIHEGDINELPDDYKCPICGVDKDLFELKI